MSGALVLNASFEALCAVSVHRAVGLMAIGKAEVVCDTGRQYHAERVTFLEPSVIRLVSYVRVPQIRRVAVTKRAIFSRDLFHCQYCGGPAENIDHIVPRSRGGTHTWDNVVAACRSCNSRKRDRLLSETSFQLRRPPRVPIGRSWAIALGPVRTEWLPYLELWTVQPEQLAI
ncbi:MAG: HNH endonuclease [Ferrimicrobium sp.]